MTGAEALAQAVADLRAIDGGARDARVLLAHALGMDRTRLTLVLADPMTPAQQATFAGMIARRAGNMPVSHIIGSREFYGRRFIVTADVLDPRPETETLIAAALEVPFTRVLDLGTGSGCILLTLLAEQAGATGLGTDHSNRALEVARDNAQALGLEQRCTFHWGDWYDGVPRPEINDGREVRDDERVGGDGPKTRALPVVPQFDLIVANPPYIALDEMDGLAPDLSFEPRAALTDGADGLDAYRAICAGVGQHLLAQGWMVVEIGPTQGRAVADMMRAAGMESVEIRADLDGRDRVVLGQKFA